jgi:hypothetical protein
MRAAVLCVALAWSGAAAAEKGVWFHENGSPTEEGQRVMAEYGLPRLIEGSPLFTRAVSSACLTIQFVIREDGLTDHFLVLDADPPGALKDDALRALRFWKFQPVRHRRSVVLPISVAEAGETGSRLGKATPRCAVPAVRVTGMNLGSDTRGRMPYFPPELVRERKRGCVTLAFKVRNDRKADEYGVVDAQPDQAFVGAAIAALNEWKFDDVPPGKQGVVRFVFDPDTLAEVDPPQCRWPKGKQRPAATS